MIETQKIEHESQRSLTRILQKVEEVLKPEIKKDSRVWRQISSRLHRNLPTLFT
jgi:hypothetical protein